MRERLGGSWWPAKVSPPQGGKWLGEEVIGMGNLGLRSSRYNGKPLAGRESIIGMGNQRWDGKLLGWEIIVMGNCFWDGGGGDGGDGDTGSSQHRQEIFSKITTNRDFVKGCISSRDNQLAGGQRACIRGFGVRGVTAPRGFGAILAAWQGPRRA